MPSLSFALISTVITFPRVLRESLIVFWVFVSKKVLIIKDKFCWKELFVYGDTHDSFCNIITKQPLRIWWHLPILSAVLAIHMFSRLFCSISEFKWLKRAMDSVQTWINGARAFRISFVLRDLLDFKSSKELAILENTPIAFKTQAGNFWTLISLGQVCGFSISYKISLLHFWHLRLVNFLDKDIFLILWSGFFY